MEPKIKLDKLIAAMNESAKARKNNSVNFRLASEKEPITTITTGSYTYDHIIGGGIPENRITEIYGPESSAKSTICLAVISQAQKLGYYVLFFDAEGTIDFDFGQIHGLDKDKVIYTGDPEVDNIFDFVQKFSAYIAEKDPDGKILCVVDSIASMTDNSTIENKMGDSEMAVMARKMGKALKKVCWLQNKYKNLTLICTNQIRDDFNKMKMPGMPAPVTTPGGRALKFYSSVRLEMASTEKIKDGDEIIGCYIRLKCVKNKIAPPGKMGRVALYYKTGFDKIEEMFDEAMSLNILNLDGRIYTFKEFRFNGASNVKEALKEDKVFRDQISAAIDQILGSKIIEKNISESEYKEFEKITEESVEEMPSDLAVVDDSALEDDDIVLDASDRTKFEKIIPKTE